MTVKLHWTPWGRTHVVLVDNTDSANGLATVIPANYLILYVSPPDANSSLDNYKNYLEMLFTHEFTHILHIDQHFKIANPPHWVFGKIVAPNGLTPGWMREGMAAFEESVETGFGRANSSYSDMVLRAAILEGNFPKIDEAAGLGYKWPGADSQYIYGVKFWQWLANKYGEESIQKYMQKYASSVWLFSLNNKAKRIYGKSFYQLWDDWKKELFLKYQEAQKTVESQGVTPFALLTHSPNTFSYPTVYPLNGEKYAYYYFSLDEPGGRFFYGDNGAKKRTINYPTGQMAYSGDGNFLATSTASSVQKHNQYHDIYISDFKNDTVLRSCIRGEEKKSLRSTDPDFFPFDGGHRWVVMVRTNLGTDNLYVYDYLKKKGYFLTNAPSYTQFSNPRISPDGEKIAISRHDHDGFRDIVIYSKTGEELFKLTDDQAVDNSPIWHPDGKSIYYVSDKDGIPNVYQKNLEDSSAVMQITHVLSGVSRPQISPDGKILYAQFYTSKGWQIARVGLSPLGKTIDIGVPPPENQKVVEDKTKTPSPNDQEQPPLTPLTFDSSTSFGLFEDPPSPSGAGQQPPKKVKKEKTCEEIIKLPEDTTPPTPYELSLLNKKPPPVENVVIPGSQKYNAFPDVLVPRYVLPIFATLEDSFIAGFGIGRFDPMYRHSWSLAADYRSDAKFVDVTGVYSYLRYAPSFFTGFSRYALNWGITNFSNGADFFESRLQGFIGMSGAIGRNVLLGNYFFEERDNLTGIIPVANPPQLNRNAGFRFQYINSKYKAFPNSISQEDGFFFKSSLEVTDSLLGSSDVNEQVTLTGDFRYYFEMPWSNHHVLGLRLAGGYVMGDREQIASGSLRFGGPFGEGVMAGYGNLSFPFRGFPGVTFAADRVALASVEYRLPIANVERGLGTLPIFLRKIYVAPFADFGDSWQRNGKDGRDFFEDFFLSLGAELKSDLVLGYGLPVTARLGYAMIVLNRDQVNALAIADGLTGQNITNGTFYLQFGTSF